MKKTSLIGHVVELLDLIRPLRQPADSIVREFFASRRYLGSKDRRFISETIFGILRNYMLLKATAEEAMKSVQLPAGSVPSLLIYAAYALSTRHEEHLGLCADVRGFLQMLYPHLDCPALMTALSGAALTPGDLAGEIALRHSFPRFLVEEWVERMGDGETRRLCGALNLPAPLTIRVNTLKASVDECRLRLREEGIESAPTTLSPFGLILDKRFNAQAHQSFRDGWFEMQDEGSQLLSMLLEPRPEMVVVDACAGGGGKTLHIAALMQNRGNLHAIDVEPKRLAALGPRIARAGVHIAQLHRAGSVDDSMSFLAGNADAVLVDAPCSGAGTFRRNPAAKLTVNREFVDRMSDTQRRLLGSYAHFVKPGGRLVYSTCTLLREENEDVVEDFGMHHPEFSVRSAASVLARQGIDLEQSSRFLTLLPHKTGTDGFFAAVLERKA